MSDQILLRELRDTVVETRCTINAHVSESDAYRSQMRADIRDIQDRMQKIENGAIRRAAQTSIATWIGNAVLSIWAAAATGISIWQSFRACR